MDIAGAEKEMIDDRALIDDRRVVADEIIWVVAVVTLWRWRFEVVEKIVLLCVSSCHACMCFVGEWMRLKLHGKIWICPDLSRQSHRVNDAFRQRDPAVTLCRWRFAVVEKIVLLCVPCLYVFRRWVNATKTSRKNLNCPDLPRQSLRVNDDFRQRDSHFIQSRFRSTYLTKQVDSTCNH